MGREKPGQSSGQLPRFLQGILKGEFMGGVSLLLYLVDLLVAVLVWLAVSFFEMDIFELETSAIKKLKSGIYTIH